MIEPPQEPHIQEAGWDARPTGTGRPFPRARVLHASVDLASPDEILTHLIAQAEARRGCWVAGISAPYATAMQGDPELRETFAQADVLVPDGQGFAWGARLLGVECGERLAIPDLCEKLLIEADARGWGVFLYGATEAVNAAACENLRRRFPKIARVDGQHGYGQTAAEEDALIERLAAGGHRLLIVARPTPDKEEFLQRCCARAGVVGVAAGGYADVLAGLTRRAPKWVQACGMEWFFRVVQEPRRLWKRVGLANARFALLVLWTHLRQAPRAPWWCSRWVQTAAILLAVTASYVGFLSAPYHFDDPEYIQRNTAIRSWDGLSKMSVLAHRKLWWYSNAICYAISEKWALHQPNKPDVRVFRAWNIGCHLIAALALYALIRRCLRARDPDARGGANELIPFVSAAIFAAHPLCTESVTYISGRDNGQGGMFYLLGLWAAAVMFGRMTARGDASTLVGKPPVARWPSWAWPAFGTLLMGACAVLTKESYLTFPVAVALVYACFYRGSGALKLSTGLFLGVLAAIAGLAWGAAGRYEGRLGAGAEAGLLALVALGLAGASQSENFIARRLRTPINAGWAFLFGTLGLGACAIAAFPYAYERTIGALTGYQNSSYVRSLVTQAHAVPLMLLRAIAPIHTGPAEGYGLNIDHDFPTLTSLSDPRAMTGVCVIAALLIFGGVALWRRWLGGFAVLLALVTIAPTNSVIERGDVVSERNFYLAAAAGAVLLAWVAAGLATLVARASVSEPEARPAEASMWAALLGVCIASPFASFSVLRNFEWNDSYRLWESARLRSPGKMRVQFNFGVVAMARRRYDEAENAFSNAIRIGEDKAQKQLFRPDEAVEIKCFHLAYSNLANLQIERAQARLAAGDLSSIVRVQDIFSRGVERTAYDPDLCFAYATVLLQLGRPGDVLPLLTRSLELHNWADHLTLPLGFSLLEVGQYERAVQQLRSANELKDRDSLGNARELPDEMRSQTLIFLAAAELLAKHPAEARAHFKQSLELEPRAAILLLTTSGSIRNRKLKPAETDPPDPLLTAMSIARRDVLVATAEAIEGLGAGAPERHKTILSMLKDAIRAELTRRDAVQKKRREFGFTDDPEAE